MQNQDQDKKNPDLNFGRDWDKKNPDLDFRSRSGRPPRFSPPIVAGNKDKKTDQHVVVEELLDAVGLAAAVEEPGDDHGQLKVVQLVDANLAKDRS